MALVHEGLKAKSWAAKDICQEVQNWKFWEKRTFAKNLKWEMDEVERLRRLSCWQVQAEI